MTDVVILAIIGAIPSTIIAMATLTAVLKNNYQINNLHDLVDGKLSDMIAALREASEIKGKVDAIHEASKPVTVITDRRKDADISN